MSTAYKIGAKAGTAGAWVLSKSFHVACNIASGAGEFGSGFIDEGGAKFTEYNMVNEALRVAAEAATKARIKEIRALHAAKMLTLSAPAAPVAPAAMAAAS